MIGQSAAFLAVQYIIAKMAEYNAPALIEGETGTGKELAARAIHYNGARRDRPFVPVNCGALPDTLIESELFGHRRGAFTDAREHQPGLITVAQSGTLFLDEVDALTPKAQVVILRFLQDQQYRPVGARREERADVRIIAASNQPLDGLVDTGRFRIDLLHRLRLMHLRLPPLRERHGDVELLAQHFLEVGSARFCRPIRPFAAGTLAWFNRYAWPGNIRELEHVIYEGLLLCDAPSLVIPAPPGVPEIPISEADPNYRRAKQRAVAEFERTFLTRVIRQTQGNISAAARLAGTERRHLGRLLRKHRLIKSSQA